MGAAALPLAIVGQAGSFGASLLGSRERARGAREQSEEMLVQAAQEKAEAAIRERDRQAQAGDVLDRIALIFSGKGVSLDSGSVEALSRGLEKDVFRESLLDRFFVNQRQKSIISSANSVRANARTARLVESVGAGFSLLGDVGETVLGVDRYREKPADFYSKSNRKG